MDVMPSTPAQPARSFALSLSAPGSGSGGGIGSGAAASPTVAPAAAMAAPTSARARGFLGAASAAVPIRALRFAVAPGGGGPGGGVAPPVQPLSPSNVAPTTAAARPGVVGGAALPSQPTAAHPPIPPPAGVVAASPTMAAPPGHLPRSSSAASMASVAAQLTPYWGGASGGASMFTNFTTLGVGAAAGERPPHLMLHIPHTPLPGASAAPTTSSLPFGGSHASGLPGLPGIARTPSPAFMLLAPPPPLLGLGGGALHVNPSTIATLQFMLRTPRAPLPDSAGGSPTHGGGAAAAGAGGRSGGGESPVSPHGSKRRGSWGHAGRNWRPRAGSLGSAGSWLGTVAGGSGGSAGSAALAAAMAAAAAAAAATAASSAGTAAAAAAAPGSGNASVLGSPWTGHDATFVSGTTSPPLSAPLSDDTPRRGSARRKGSSASLTSEGHGTAEVPSPSAAHRRRSLQFSRRPEAPLPPTPSNADAHVGGAAGAAAVLADAAAAADLDAAGGAPARTVALRPLAAAPAPAASVLSFLAAPTLPTAATATPLRRRGGGVAHSPIDLDSGYDALAPAVAAYTGLGGTAADAAPRGGTGDGSGSGSSSSAGVPPTRTPPALLPAARSGVLGGDLHSPTLLQLRPAPMAPLPPSQPVPAPAPAPAPTAAPAVSSLQMLAAPPFWERVAPSLVPRATSLGGGLLSGANISTGGGAFGTRARSVAGSSGAVVPVGSGAGTYTDDGGGGDGAASGGVAASSSASAPGIGIGSRSSGGLGGLPIAWGSSAFTGRRRLPSPHLSAAFSAVGSRQASAPSRLTALQRTLPGASASSAFMSVALAPGTSAAAPGSSRSDGGTSGGGGGTSAGGSLAPSGAVTPVQDALSGMSLRPPTSHRTPP